VDKVQVTIFTDDEKMVPILEEARKAWSARDERIAGMTDESVDTFYSCTLCQSYAPNHVCIISPERLGLCGAYNWLDGRAAFEINPAGPNQPVQKGRVIDEIKGQWEGVNEFVYNASNKSVERFNAYSLMEDPMTSCGCFECIIAILPECNGFMIVNREFPGMTPCGMPFTTLAGSVGGGLQTPGFLGIGRLYISSRKFISAEGGQPRIVWMPKELKEDIAERFNKRAAEIGMPDLIDKIADETVATTSEELLAFLQEKDHPALKMDPLF
jgi:acetyl-CoA synthase